MVGGCPVRGSEPHNLAHARDRRMEPALPHLGALQDSVGIDVVDADRNRAPASRDLVPARGRKRDLDQRSAKTSPAATLRRAPFGNTCP